MRTVSVVVGMVVICVAGLALAAWFGVYNMSAADPHWGITFTVIQEVRDRSIVVHSRGIRVPSMNDPRLDKEGAEHYHESCRLCHGAPGSSRSDFANGLYPFPQRLHNDEVQARKDGELFWIVKNGLKMTGMPSFGILHGDEDIWGLVAFLRRLPKLEVEEYNALITSSDQGKEDGSPSDNAPSPGSLSGEAPVVER